MLQLDLSATTVFLDFDGTITQHDSCVHLLSRTAGDSWRAVEDLYVSGSIGSRECLQRQWDLIANRDEQELRRIVREVPLDPGFSALIQSLRTAGAETVVLSDGYGFYAEEICQRWDVALISNHIEWSDWTVTFPAISARCECPGCGTCKPAAIRAARRGGRTTVLVGDGASDRRGAAVADRVFAKADLAKWCRAAQSSINRSPALPTS
jgi:HAD superfamily phosphoserine phosphatase-like hydrolase